MERTVDEYITDMMVMWQLQAVRHPAGPVPAAAQGAALASLLMSLYVTVLLHVDDEAYRATVRESMRVTAERITLLAETPVERLLVVSAYLSDMPLSTQ